MIILGIDPAIRCSGYGVIEMRSAGNFSILDCGIIKNSPKIPHSECLLRIVGGIRELAEKFTPETASIEDPFVGKNAKTAIILGMARGAILSVLAEYNIPVFPYSPRTAKKSAVGRGSATKEQIAGIMAAEFGISVSDIPLDSTDALALALCHGLNAVRPELANMPAPL